MMARQPRHPCPTANKRAATIFYHELFVVVEYGRDAKLHLQDIPR
jgi:hypothetical protein